MTDANPLSILDTVKKVLGFTPDYEAFDLDIIMHINSAFGTLFQLGVGSGTGFSIADNTTLWSDYISNTEFLGMVQQFIFLSTKLAFDTPATSFAIEAIQGQIQQLGWRINVAVEQALLTPSGVEMLYGTQVYISSDEPVHAPDGALWVDTALDS